MNIVEMYFDFILNLSLETWLWLSFALVMFCWDDWSIQFHCWQYERKEMKRGKRHAKREANMKKYGVAEWRKMEHLRRKYTRAELRAGYGQDD